MIVYHVTSITKFLKYLRLGVILPPVRAWRNIEAAEDFSKRTGRTIILRLKFPEDVPFLPGHKHQAVYMRGPVYMSEVFNGWEARVFG